MSEALGESGSRPDRRSRSGSRMQRKGGPWSTAVEGNAVGGVVVTEPTEGVTASSEQAFYDHALDCRERHRAKLHDGAAAGINRGAGAAIGRIADAAWHVIGRPEDDVVVGMMEFDDGVRLHVGKHGVFDDDKEVIVVNWTLPAAVPFYRATPTDHQGLRAKWGISVAHHQVTAIEEQIFADLAARIEELDRPFVTDTLLQDLSRHRTGEMEDIVATITAAQFDLIAAPLDQMLVVQGGPGTGKTAVALHRAVWLLANHRDELTPQDVLIVGPHAAFTRYISRVLPTLGENRVTQLDIGRLAPEVPRIGRDEPPDLARLKGDGRMAGVISGALRQRVRVPADGITLPAGVRQIRLDASWLDQRVDQLASLAYASGRERFRDLLGREVEARAGLTEAQARTTELDNAVQRIWPTLSAASFLAEFLGSPGRITQAAGDELTAKEAGMLYRKASDKVGDETWSEADLPLLDEADWLISDQARQRYGHIILDEAQDMSPMQLRAVARRSASGSLTVLGDLAQSTGAWARDSWDEVLTHLPSDLKTEVRELRFGYRVPAEVFDLASQLLPVIAPSVNPPDVVRSVDVEPLLIETSLDDGLESEVVDVAMRFAAKGNSVGVICPDHRRSEVIAALNGAGVTFADATAGELGSSINLLRPAEAKGLEFDSIVVVDPATIVQEVARGHRMLYVALTRTTKLLAVVHTGDPLALGEDSNGPVAGQPPEDSTADLLISEPLTDEAGGRPTPSVVGALAATLAGQVREVVGQDHWTALVTALADEFGLATVPKNLNDRRPSS
jgi:DNA helicase IV